MPSLTGWSWVIGTSSSLVQFICMPVSAGHLDRTRNHAWFSELLHSKIFLNIFARGDPALQWLHAATRGCGYPADSSDLAAETVWAAGAAATFTPSLLRRWSDRGLRLTPGPVPADDPLSHAWRASATNTDSVADRAPPRALPGARPLTVLAQANCDGLRLPLVSDSLSPRWAEPRRRGVGCPQCRLRLSWPLANCDGPSTPPVRESRDSLTPRLATGPGTHSVSQGLTVTAAPPTRISQVCRRSTGAGRPRFRSKS